MLHKKSDLYLAVVSRLSLSLPAARRLRKAGRLGRGEHMTAAHCYTTCKNNSDCFLLLFAFVSIIQTGSFLSICVN